MVVAKKCPVFKLSEDGACIEGKIADRTRGLPVFVCRVRIGRSVIEREIVQVTVKHSKAAGDKGKGQYWVDRVTGSLYSQASGGSLANNSNRLMGLPVRLKPTASICSEDRAAA